MPNNGSVVNSQQADYFLIIVVTKWHQFISSRTDLFCEKLMNDMSNCFIVFRWFDKEPIHPLVHLGQIYLVRTKQHLTYPVLSDRFQWRFLPARTVVVPCAACWGCCSSMVCLLSSKENPLSSVPWPRILEPSHESLQSSTAAWLSSALSTEFCRYRRLVGSF